MDKPIVKSNNRVRELRLIHHLTQSELAEKTQLSYSSIVSYENGLRDPNARAMATLESFFGVSGEYLLGLTDINSAKVRTFSASHNKAPILEKYERLDQHGKELVDLIVNKELERCGRANKMTDDAVMVSFRISDQPASAGTGVYLGPDGFTEHMVNAEAVNGADFGVPVSGDSMEPLYKDGDIILVSMSSPVQMGDIALVTMDGCGYVKKLGKGVLISVNHHYDPIPVTEDIRINGKVIGVLPAQIE